MKSADSRQRIQKELCVLIIMGICASKASVAIQRPTLEPQSDVRVDTRKLRAGLSSSLLDLKKIKTAPELSMGRSGLWKRRVSTKMMTETPATLGAETVGVLTDSP